MVPFIEAPLVTLKKMGLAGFSSTMAFSILVYGKMENLTPMKEYKYILMAASTLEVSSTESKKEKVSIFGLMEKFILGNSKMVICMVEEL
jgi:hypothetical protein